MMRRVQSEPKLSQVRSDPRLSYVSAVSASYLPGRDPPVYKLSRSCKYGKYDVLQKNGIGVDRPASVAARIGGPGRPRFVTEIKEKERTASNECRDRIRAAMRNRDLKGLQEAYRNCFSDQWKEMCFVATREVKPLQKMIRRFHDEELEEAIRNDDRKALEKAIQNAESDDTIAVALGEDVPPIMLSRPPKLTEAKLLLEKIIKMEKRAEATREPESAPDFSKKKEVPEPPPKEDRMEQGNSLKNLPKGAAGAEVKAKVEEVKNESPPSPKQEMPVQGTLSVDEAPVSPSPSITSSKSEKKKSRKSGKAENEDVPVAVVTEPAIQPTLSVDEAPASPSPSEASSKSEKRKSRKSGKTVNEDAPVAVVTEPAIQPTLSVDEAPASPSPSEASSKSEKRKSRKSKKSVNEDAPVDAVTESTPPVQNVSESMPKPKQNETPLATETTTPTPRLEISRPLPARTTTVAFAEDVQRGSVASPPAATPPAATPPVATPPAATPPAVSSPLEAMQARLAAAKSKAGPNLEEVKARLAAAKAKAAAAKAQAELASSG